MKSSAVLKNALVVSANSIAALIVFSCQALFAQPSKQHIEENLYLFVEEDGIQYYILDQGSGLNIEAYAMELRKPQKIPWHKRKVIQDAIATANQPEDLKQPEIPNALTQYGFTDRLLLDHRLEGNFEYFTFSNWHGAYSNQPVTFVVIRQ